jgi:translation initiation factor 1
VSDSRLVYSTEGGDRRRDRPAPQPPAGPPPGDGIVRVLRERRRGGKPVTVVRGLPGGREELARTARELKRLCGAGGTVADGDVEVQGDHREAIAAHLTGQGLRVRIAGG